MIAILSVILQAGECAKESPYYSPIGLGLGPDPTTGDIVGQVTVDGTARAGVTVTLRRNGTIVDTRMTNMNGEYEFLELQQGAFTVSVGTIANVTCPGEQTAQVLADIVREVDFPCTSAPTTGTVTGTVTLDGSPVEGVTVALDSRTTMTDANGMFSFTMVDPGAYGVAASISGADCPPQTTTVTAGQTSTVNVSCTSTAPSGSEIAAVSYSLTGTLMGTDGCGLGATISNPGPIAVLVETVSGQVFLVIVSDAQVRAVYVLGQTWSGTGETTISSGGGTFTLRESVTGTWESVGGLIRLVGVLRFEIFMSGGTKVCESAYNATYMQLAASSHRFKTRIAYLLPDGVSILGLRPAAFRYRASYGDPSLPRLGLIAEDVIATFPGAVAVDGRGRPLGIAYGILRRLVVEEAASRVAGAMESGIRRLAWVVPPR